MTIHTLNHLFRASIQNNPRPDRMMYKSEGKWVSVSSERLDRETTATSQGLVGLGLLPGDRVALVSETRYEWCVADLGILGAGGINVPVYPTLLTDQIAYILQDSKPKMVICSTPEHAARIESIKDTVPSLELIVCMDPRPRPGALSLRDVQKIGLDRLAVDRSDHDRLAALVKPDDIATIVYTSGTTGNPKGAMLTHDNMVQSILGSAKVLDTSPEDIALSFLPLSHVFERAAHYYLLLQGVRICYAESIEKVPENIVELRPTVMVAVPRLLEKAYARVLKVAEESCGAKRRTFFWAKEVGRRVASLKVQNQPVPRLLSLQARMADRLVFSKLRQRFGGQLRFFISAGAPLSVEVAGFFSSAGINVLEGYGLTEVSGGMTINHKGAARLGSVGKALPGVEIRINDDGEILTRSRMVMRGYLNQPEATREAIQDGWFYTGDIGRFDTDGFLYITDRKKDLIVTAGGKNIAPQPTENRLKQHRYIAELALIGDRHKYVVALIVPNFEELEAFAAGQGIAWDSRARLLDNGHVLALFQGAIDEANQSLSRYEQIKKFALLDRDFSIETGELTPTLKVKRRVIQEKYGDLIRKLYGDDEQK